MNKILLIEDDNGGITSSLVADLEVNGFKVALLNNAEEVLELLSSEQYKAIILDVMLPVPETWPMNIQRKCKDGLETGVVLFKAIRKVHPSLPVLCYTAKTHFQIKNNSFTYSLRKPELNSTLIEKLNQLISYQ